MRDKHSYQTTDITGSPQLITGNKQQAIRLAMLGFDNEQGQLRLASLFNNSKHWLVPWQVVDNLADAEFLFIAMRDGEAMPQHEDFDHRHIIIYANQANSEARWHLRRPAAEKMPSPLEFTILLKEISQAYSKGLLVSQKPEAAPKPKPAVLAIKPTFNWRERLKVLIVGSIGSGKTTAINTLSDGNAISTEAVPSDHTKLQKKSTTVAMDFGTLAIDHDTQVLVYGAPGQRRFDFMSDILIQNALGIIILISNESSNPFTELNYYLDANRNYLLTHHAVIGITHNDINPTPSLKEYVSFIDSRGDAWPVLKVDARNGDDMKILVNELLDATIRRG